MTVSPRVSIITPCYNGERYLADCLSSVQQQRFELWEQIIVDDGSTDGSTMIAHDFAQTDPRVCLFTQANSGVCRARNTGFGLTNRRSEYLLFLDQDDCLEPLMLERMIGFLDACPSAAMAHCRYRPIDSNSAEIAGNIDHYFDRYVRKGNGVSTLLANVSRTPIESIFAMCVIMPSITVMRRCVYEATPGWDESFGQFAEDTDLFLHIALRGDVHFVNEELVRWRQHNQQASADPLRQAEQKAKLHKKWVRADWLTTEQRAIIEDAWRFREGKLLPDFWLRAAQSHFRSCHWMEACKCVARSVRQRMRYVTGREPGSYYS